MEGCGVKGFRGAAEVIHHEGKSGSRSQDTGRQESGMRDGSQKPCEHVLVWTPFLLAHRMLNHAKQDANLHGFLDKDCIPKTGA